MKFDLFIDGKAYNVELGIDELITIEIDGKSYQAETKKTEDGITILIDKKKFFISFEGPYISINDIKHKIEVRNLRRGKPSWYDTKEEKEELKVGKPTQKMHIGEGLIHPPMPGRVISIKVKEGDTVKKGSPILVLEAMKMQNEVVSTIGGIVREIRISEGDLVESKDILVVIGN